MIRRLPWVAAEQFAHMLPPSHQPPLLVVAAVAAVQIDYYPAALLRVGPNFALPELEMVAVAVAVAAAVATAAATAAEHLVPGLHHCSGFVNGRVDAARWVEMSTEQAWGLMYLPPSSRTWTHSPPPNLG